MDKAACQRVSIRGQSLRLGPQLVEQQVRPGVIDHAVCWDVRQVSVVKAQPAAIALAHVRGVMPRGRRLAMVQHRRDQLVLRAGTMARLRAQLCDPAGQQPADMRAELSCQHSRQWRAQPLQPILACP